MDVKPRNLNTGEATCNLRVLTFVNAHHSVYSNKMPSILSQIFFQINVFQCWSFEPSGPCTKSYENYRIEFLHQRALTKGKKK